MEQIIQVRLVKRDLSIRAGLIFDLVKDKKMQNCSQG
jgi:hypothetical protein